MALAPRIDSIQAGQNLAINGNFDFFQRGVGPITTNNNVLTFLADRFRVQNTLTSNVQIERSTDVPTLAQSGFQSQYSLKLTNSASPSSPTTGYVNVRYVVEGYDYQQLHGKPFRVQVWVKSSLVGTYSLCFKNNAGTRSYVSTCTIFAANTWEKKVVDLTGDTAGTWLFDNSAGLRVLLNLQTPSSAETSSLNTWLEDAGNAIFASSTQTDWAATASATFFIAQVSIIPGSFSSDTDIPFKRAGRTISDELAMCQRYYEKSYDIDTVPGTSTGVGISMFRSSTDAGANGGGTIYYKAIKRNIANAPIFYRQTGELGNWNYAQNGSSGFATMSAQLQGQTSVSVFGAGVTNWAPLTIYGHWTVDAEL
jgi:hypothetical protein